VPETDQKEGYDVESELTAATTTATEEERMEVRAEEDRMMETGVMTTEEEVGAAD
jgi:hypothetical protein